MFLLLQQLLLLTCLCLMNPSRVLRQQIQKLAQYSIHLLLLWLLMTKKQTVLQYHQQQQQQQQQQQPHLSLQKSRPLNSNLPKQQQSLQEPRQLRPGGPPALRSNQATAAAAVLPSNQAWS